MPQQLSLAVVGADHPNKDKSNRRFEILLCVPGEPVHLAPEPSNPADPNAVAVLSSRGVQIGYLTAERAPWIGGMIRNGREITAIFQQVSARGAIIRVAFDGLEPILPPVAAQPPSRRNADDAFDGIDPVYPDD